MLEITELEVRFDDDGFLVDPAEWTETSARTIAHQDGLGELDPQQLSLLHHLRLEYLRTGAVPALMHICHLGGYEAGCMTRLFPDAREAWRIAGLPNPGEEAKAYM